MMYSEGLYRKIYSGILGKIVGVYIGRPFEGWDHSQISKNFGDINCYVNEEVDHPLICSDDDITGTFMFTHALEDHLFRKDFSSVHVGQTWLDILIKGKTVLWWGGYGQSTEHTAWQNLKNGIPAPQSGSIETNGQTVAEQIGAQIFIDGWGMLNPNMPDKAANMAREAGLVSHDGASVDAAIVIAVIESLAFNEANLDTLIDSALSYISQDSIIQKVITDVRQWHSENPQDWRYAFTKLRDKYGYDKFDGTCHVVPNHGLIILSLLYGEDNFHKAMMIVNTAGWDTDCNAANVGCINGIRLDLDSINDGYDWRGPVADRILLPTAHIHEHISDALREADKMMELIVRWHTGKTLPRKPRFHFSLPGAVQGFQLDSKHNHVRTATLSNSNNALTIDYKNLIAGIPLKVKTATHTDKECKVNESSYHVVGSPTLYPGQVAIAEIELAKEANADVEACLFIEMYDTALNITTQSSDTVRLKVGERNTIEWTIPTADFHMIANVGIEITGTTERAQHGQVRLHQLDWTGTPTQIIGFDKTKHHEIWESSFINTMDTKIKFDNQDIYRLVNDDITNPGVFTFGSKDFKDYELSIRLVPQTKNAFGPIVRYLGLTRYYRIELTKDDTAILIHESFGESRIIAVAPFEWQPHKAYEFKVKVVDDYFKCSINGVDTFSVRDAAMPETFKCGGVGFYNSLGPVHFTDMKITSVTSINN
ncbi:ADP-ribosylglycohydrolase family protein [Vibrio aestuarianus]|uniref:ADP-ribosylglycohydrolase family protein n=1 Tax=Vibrio aestuarianus TaxID=28171 RepID=UPI00237D2562|nr:ADP-ribosylglycohydrolase family protein [Vibrio aestuarianus]MDE1248484.1 ADP-ribosylglycohydrolase family protein [Vibrio aestuarianus]